jgi:hypothetical protein
MYPPPPVHLHLYMDIHHVWTAVSVSFVSLKFVMYKFCYV